MLSKGERLEPRPVAPAQPQATAAPATGVPMAR
jgi:hypothetical protein